MNYMINNKPSNRQQPASVMAMCHTLMMALSPDLSGGERKSHHLTDSKIVLP